MTAVHGRDMDIFIERNGVFVFTACATSCDMEVSAEEINITTADSGRENEYDGGSTDCVGSMDGVITLDTLGGWQYEDWREATGTVIPLRFDMTNVYGDRLRYEMNVLILNVGVQGGVNEHGAFNVSWKRSGAETVTKTIVGGLQDSNLDYILDGNGVIIR
jgi:hypothetical protein